MTVSLVRSDMKNALPSGVKDSCLSHPFMGGEGCKAIFIQGSEEFRKSDIPLL